VRTVSNSASATPKLNTWSYRGQTKNHPRGLRHYALQLVRLDHFPQRRSVLGEDLGQAQGRLTTSETKPDGRAALPSEASAAEVAKEGQHNNDDDDDPENRHVILSLGASRLYGEPTRFRNLRDLRREWARV
jgi:hypothetical protein